MLSYLLFTNHHSIRRYIIQTAEKDRQINKVHILIFLSAKIIKLKHTGKAMSVSPYFIFKTFIKSKLNVVGSG
jgi:cytochrome c oxidase assembly factor CtaG